jgi:hypothetical protein
MSTKIDKWTPPRPRKRGQRLTAKERKVAQAEFLDALGRTANITAACMQAGISRSLVYVWQEHDDGFAYEFQEANKRANDLLFGECWRRAMIGEERYVVSQGKLIMKPNGEYLTYREKSDGLLTLLLKARLPEFREKQQIEMSGSLDVAGAKASLLAKLAQMARSLHDNDTQDQEDQADEDQ